MPVPRNSNDEKFLTIRSSRREWLRRSGVVAGGLVAQRSLNTTLGQCIAAESRRLPQRGFGKAKSVIVLYASGGQSQLETWDPKPLAPESIRGEFGSIATTNVGVRLCEHMPRLAQLAHRYTIVRSMSHDDLDHGSASYLSLTGQFHPRKSSNPPPRQEDAPAFGAILQLVRPSSRFPHTAVHVNGPLLVPEEPSPGQFGGFLGRKFDPLTVGDVSHSAVAIDGLDPLPELSFARQTSRQSLLESIDLTAGMSHQRYTDLSDLYRQAQTLLGSAHCRSAFDLSRESDATRNRYGRFRTGQACLLARRLVEAGVPWITVMMCHSARGQDKHPNETDFYGWDTHNDIFDAMKNHLLPRFDISVAALLEDLEERGLLDSTLVVCMGEFGRAPRVALEPNFTGSSPGRKHWAQVYSIMLAGAGIAKGRVVGASDRIAANPETTPISPGDLAATIFFSLGIDPASHYTDATGRPFPVATGKAIEDAFA